MRTWYIHLVLAALLLSACDTTTSPPALNESSFEIQLSGPLNTSAGGTATFGATQTMGQPGFSDRFFVFNDTTLLNRELTLIMLQTPALTGSDHHALHFTFTQGDLPGLGTYEVGELSHKPGDPLIPPPFMVSYQRGLGDAGVELYRVDTGTVTIVASSPERIAGTFSVTAEAFMVYTPADIQALFDGEALPTEIITLEEPLTITGTFDAYATP